MQVSIEKIIYPGKSLVRPQGKVILTDEGLPGENVEVELPRERKNYIAAKTTKILSLSPERTAPRCSHAQICSVYQYIKYPFQVKIKTAQIEEIFSPLLKTAPPNVLFRPASSIWGYRNKISLKVLWKNNQPCFAYHLPKSRHQFVKIKECFLVSEQVNRLLESLLNILARHSLCQIKEIVVKESISTKQQLLVFYGKHLKDSGRLSGILDELKELFPLKGIVYIDTRTASRHLIWGKEVIEENVLGRVFLIGAESFFQVNVPMLQCLLKDMEQALSLTGTETIADLYCGTGLFGIIFAPHAKQVVSVESAAENTALLKRNAQANHINNLTVLEGDCRRLIAQTLRRPADILIIDPPRKGLDKSLHAQILQKPPRLIAYISCNPVTLARDIQTLLDAYRLTSLYSYDFFPHTPHIETLAILERK